MTKEQFERVKVLASEIKSLNTMKDKGFKAFKKNENEGLCKSEVEDILLDFSRVLSTLIKINEDELKTYKLTEPWHKHSTTQSKSA